MNEFISDYYWCVNTDQDQLNNPSRREQLGHRMAAISVIEALIHYAQRPYDAIFESGSIVVTDLSVEEGARSDQGEANQSLLDNNELRWSKVDTPDFWLKAEKTFNENKRNHNDSRFQVDYKETVEKSSEVNKRSCKINLQVILPTPLMSLNGSYQIPYSTETESGNLRNRIMLKAWLDAANTVALKNAEIKRKNKEYPKGHYQTQDNSQKEVLHKEILRDLEYYLECKGFSFQDALEDTYPIRFKKGFIKALISCQTILTAGENKLKKAELRKLKYYNVLEHEPKPEQFSIAPSVSEDAWPENFKQAQDGTRDYMFNYLLSSDEKSSVVFGGAQIYGKSYRVDLRNNRAETRDEIVNGIDMNRTQNNRIAHYLVEDTFLKLTEANKRFVLEETTRRLDRQALEYQTKYNYCSFSTFTKAMIYKENGKLVVNYSSVGNTPITVYQKKDGKITALGKLNESHDVYNKKEIARFSDITLDSQPGIQTYLNSEDREEQCLSPSIIGHTFRIDETRGIGSPYLKDTYSGGFISTPDIGYASFDIPKDGDIYVVIGAENRGNQSRGLDKTEIANIIETHPDASLGELSKKIVQNAYQNGSKTNESVLIASAGALGSEKPQIISLSIYNAKAPCKDINSKNLAQSKKTLLISSQEDCISQFCQDHEQDIFNELLAEAAFKQQFGRERFFRKELEKIENEIFESNYKWWVKEGFLRTKTVRRRLEDHTMEIVQVDHYLQSILQEIKKSKNNQQDWFETAAKVSWIARKAKLSKNITTDARNLYEKLSDKLLCSENFEIKEELAQFDKILLKINWKSESIQENLINKNWKKAGLREVKVTINDREYHKIVPSPVIKIREEIKKGNDGKQSLFETKKKIQKISHEAYKLTEMPFYKEILEDNFSALFKTQWINSHQSSLSSQTEDTHSDSLENSPIPHFLKWFNSKDRELSPLVEKGWKAKQGRMRGKWFFFGKKPGGAEPGGLSIFINDANWEKLKRYFHRKIDALRKEKNLIAEVPMPFSIFNEEGEYSVSPENRQEHLKYRDQVDMFSLMEYFSRLNPSQFIDYINQLHKKDEPPFVDQGRQPLSKTAHLKSLCEEIARDLKTGQLDILVSENKDEEKDQDILDHEDGYLGYLGKQDYPRKKKKSHFVSPPWKQIATDPKIQQLPRFLQPFGTLIKKYFRSTTDYKLQNIRAVTESVVNDIYLDVLGLKDSCQDQTVVRCTYPDGTLKLITMTGWNAKTTMSELHGSEKDEGYYIETQLNAEGKPEPVVNTKGAYQSKKMNNAGIALILALICGNRDVVGDGGNLLHLKDQNKLFIIDQGKAGEPSSILNTLQSDFSFTQPAFGDKYRNLSAIADCPITEKMHGLFMAYKMLDDDFRNRIFSSKAIRNIDATIETYETQYPEFRKIMQGVKPGGFDKLMADCVKFFGQKLERMDLKLRKLKFTNLARVKEFEEKISTIQQNKELTSKQKAGKIQKYKSKIKNLKRIKRTEGKIKAIWENKELPVHNQIMTVAKYNLKMKDLKKKKHLLCEERSNYGHILAELLTVKDLMKKNCKKVFKTMLPRMQLSPKELIFLDDMEKMFSEKVTDYLQDKNIQLNEKKIIAGRVICEMEKTKINGENHVIIKLPKHKGVVFNQYVASLDLNIASKNRVVGEDFQMELTAEAFQLLLTAYKPDHQSNPFVNHKVKENKQPNVRVKLPLELGQDFLAFVKKERKCKSSTKVIFSNDQYMIIEFQESEKVALLEAWNRYHPDVNLTRAQVAFDRYFPEFRKTFHIAIEDFNVDFVGMTQQINLEEEKAPIQKQAHQDGDNIAWLWKEEGNDILQTEGVQDDKARQKNHHYYAMNDEIRKYKLLIQEAYEKVTNQLTLPQQECFTQYLEKLDRKITAMVEHVSLEEGANVAYLKPFFESVYHKELEQMYKQFNEILYPNGKNKPMFFTAHGDNIRRTFFREALGVGEKGDWTKVLFNKHQSKIGKEVHHIKNEQWSNLRLGKVR